MKGFIYKVIRKSDGAIYIGKQSRWQTKDPSLSPSDIMGVKYFTSSKLIMDDWKANPDAYSFEVLEENLTDNAVLSATEVLFITKAWEEEKKGGPKVLNQYCNEHFHRSGPLSDDVRRKLSEAKKGRHKSEETKRKISEAKKGRHLSEEHKRKLSEANKGKHHSEEAKKKMSEAKKGKTFSEEARRNMSEAHKGKTSGRKGKHVSEETRKKISDSCKGKQFSEETRRKLSEALRGRHRSEETKRKISETKRMKRMADKG